MNVENTKNKNRAVNRNISTCEANCITKFNDSAVEIFYNIIFIDFYTHETVKIETEWRILHINRSSKSNIVDVTRSKHIHCLVVLTLTGL